MIAILIAEKCCRNPELAVYGDGQNKHIGVLSLDKQKGRLKQPHFVCRVSERAYFRREIGT
jgi:hypothetical protein